MASVRSPARRSIRRLRSLHLHSHVQSIPGHFTADSRAECGVSHRRWGPRWDPQGLLTPLRAISVKNIQYISGLNQTSSQRAEYLSWGENLALLFSPLFFWCLFATEGCFVFLICFRQSKWLANCYKKMKNSVGYKLPSWLTHFSYCSSY